MRVRIVVLADIHGNLPALEAVLIDAAAKGGADLFVDLGDSISGPLWPLETLDRLDELRPIAVRGNHERRIAFWERERLNLSDRFTVDRVPRARLESLGARPVAAIVAPGVLACHGTPVDDTAYLIERIENRRLNRDSVDAISDRIGEAGRGARVVLAGHSHRPDLVRLADGTLALNPGSVGCPAFSDEAPPHGHETGTPHARYALLTLSADGVDVDFRAVTYDHESAAKRAEAVGRRDWAHLLRTGFLIQGA